MNAWGWFLQRQDYFLLHCLLPCKISTLFMLLFMSMWWDYVSKLQPPTAPLFILKMIYKYGEPWWNCTVRGKPKNWVPVPLCPPEIQHKTEPGANPDLRCERRPEAWHCLKLRPPCCVSALWGMTHPSFFVFCGNTFFDLTPEIPRL
jgi:hypothetical protein